MRWRRRKQGKERTGSTGRPASPFRGRARRGPGPASASSPHVSPPRSRTSPQGADSERGAAQSSRSRRQSSTGRRRPGGCTRACWRGRASEPRQRGGPSRSSLRTRESVRGKTRAEGRQKKRTEDGPALLYPLLVGGVDDKHDGVAVGIVLCPDAPDVALACRRSTGQYSPECRSRCRKRTAEVPELQHGRRQRDPPDCRRRDCVSWSSSGNDRVVSVLF